MWHLMRGDIPPKPQTRDQSRGHYLEPAILAWWHDRLSPDWRPHTREQNQEILDGVGLTGPFWHLP